MKKLFAVGIILLAICISISAVSADDGFSFNFSSSDSSNSNGGSVEVNNNNVKIQDIQYTIPDGFKENQSAQIVGEDAEQDSFPGFKISSVRFDKGDDSIIIKVLFGDDKLDENTYTPGNDTVAKKVGDVDGYLAEFTDGISFNYIKDGKLIEIFAPDEKTLTSVLASSK